MEIKLAKASKVSKGRNGVFVPVAAEVVLSPDGAEVGLLIWSRRREGAPPVRVYMTVEGAREVARGILSIVGEGL